jgi:hypothetical protein
MTGVGCDLKIVAADDMTHSEECQSETGGLGSDWRTSVRLAICDCLSLATLELLKDLGGSTLESQSRKPDPGFGFVLKHLAALRPNKTYSKDL